LRGLQIWNSGPNVRQPWCESPPIGTINLRQCASGARESGSDAPLVKATGRHTAME
jgi:hypothetical protein